jgi:hypothetical protein
MRIPVTEHIAGTTLRFTWISSGTTVGGITSILRDKSETIVNTATPVDSGNGFWFAIHSIPNSAGWYVNEWLASIASNTYANRQFVRAIRPEVD